jgi:hypothetical protein
MALDDLVERLIRVMRETEKRAGGAGKEPLLIDRIGIPGGAQPRGKRQPRHWFVAIHGIQVEIPIGHALSE